MSPLLTKVIVSVCASAAAHGRQSGSPTTSNLYRVNELRVHTRGGVATVAQPLRLGRPWRGKSPRISWNAAAPQHRTAQGGAHSGRNQMSQLVAFVKSFARNEEGQDLLEYALLVALIALIAIGAVGAAGGAVNNIFTAIANALGGAA
jgi:pilus assembly protein Flp/PilA